MKIALGMSGGVDSSVCAKLLIEAGHDVTGIFLECWRGPGCRAEEDRKDALAVALDLGIPFQVLDFKDAYKQRVVDIFLHDLSLGLTPNPDVWCNTEIKFGLFYDWALQNGFEAIATGHYAGVRAGAVGNELHIPADTHKDQTYFLYRTRADQLNHILFPLSGYTKPEVRELAKKFGLPNANKPDSQGICFIGDIDVRKFVAEHLGTKPGAVLDTDGNVIGEHDGVWFFTVGQRHGFRLNKTVRTRDNLLKHVLPPFYVISKNAEENTITVGYGAETLASSVQVGDLFWRGEVSQILETPLRVRFRHGGALVPVHVSLDENDASRATLTLNEPLRGLSPGQAAVFYGAGDKPVCWGGGVILFN